MALCSPGSSPQPNSSILANLHAPLPPKDNHLLSCLSSERPGLLVWQEWRDQGMTPRPGPFPRPSVLSNPLDRRLRQGWGNWGLQAIAGLNFL